MTPSVDPTSHSDVLDAGQEEAVTVLCVDDEASILAALRRVFRGSCRLHTAESGHQGLEILAREPVDLVISDMRMPGMNGAEFLERVHALRPHTSRVLLTGFAELANAVEAVNRGRIHRYLSKPWREVELLGLVEEVREQSRLRRENLRMQALIARQNEELRQLNDALESRVQARTQELGQTVAFLDQAQEKLKKTLFLTMQLFSRVIDMRETRLAGHGKRVADLSRRLASKLGMDTGETQNVLFAALLHDIALIGVSDALLTRPFSALSGQERIEFMRHPARGEAILAELDMLRGAARLVRHHHERFDGGGYPDGLKGLAIPLGARILALVNDYDDLQRGQLTATPMREPEARAFLLEAAGKRYDPVLVDAFLDILKNLPAQPAGEMETVKRSLHLHAGMVLSRDIMTHEGVLLLPKGFVLSDSAIQQIVGYEKTEPKPLLVWVKE